MSISLKSWIGHRLREGLLHLDRIKLPQSEKRLVMFPCGDLNLSSSRERAYNLGKNLQKFGWRVTIAPCQLELEQRLRLLHLEKPQVLYIQKGRHKLNLPKLYHVPCIIFDLDDADFLDPKSK